MPVADAGLFELPLAVVDVETTGLTPGLDRVVEVCVFRVEPSLAAPFRAFDSLVNPHRKIRHAHVHQIEAPDAEQAPSFEDIAKRLYQALEGAVLVAHNAQFDLRFLAAEFANVDCPFDPPYLCTRGLPAVLGMTEGSQSLEALCQALGVPLGDAHVARNDARAATMGVLWMRSQLAQRGCQTYRDLTRVGSSGWYRFFESFERDVLPPNPPGRLRTSVHPLCPRVLGDEAPQQTWAPGDQEAVETRREDYTSALLEAVSDYQLSRKQFRRLRDLQTSTHLSPARIRAVHAQVVSWVLSEYTRDDELDDKERRRLSLLFECLGQLGWAPGM